MNNHKAINKYEFLVKTITFISFLMATIISFSVSVYANDSMKIKGSLYEMTTKIDYEYEGLVPLTVTQSEHDFAGELVISGKDILESKYEGTLAYGASGNVSFSFNYDVEPDNGNGWHIVEDKEKNVLGRKLDDNILRGAMFIEKSKDGVNYEDAVNPTLDFFNSETSGITLYSTSGEDISNGIFLRFIFTYKVDKVDGKYLYLIDKKDHSRIVEVYDFYVVENSGVISIHNLSTNEELLKSDEYSQELLKHGETLVDGSVTRDGFSIEQFANSYEITVQKNDEKVKLYKAGEKYTEDGKYVITVNTKLNKKISKTIYVFKGGNDKGYSTYFGDGLVQAERVFRDGQVPTYARGGQIHINEINQSIPALNVIVTNLEDNSTLYSVKSVRSEQTVALAPGRYRVKISNGDNEKAGSTYCYTFKFDVIDEESAPYVNSYKLFNTEQIEDIQSKHYEVSYQTTSGGYIYVCFSLDSYDEALDYARDIEGRFVEEAEDGNYYYKAIDNANVKVKYYDKTELTAAREYYAKQNVEISYFNVLDKFTYQTYENNLLECLEDLNITESIKVFPSQNEKDKLIQRVPYLNGFTFIQASDYDVISVEAQNVKTGVISEIKLGRPVNEQLSESAVYHIKETNLYGKTKEYNASYMAECNTTMTWFVQKDGNERHIDINNSDDGMVIEADSAYVKSITNEYDDWAIVTIKAPDVYSFEIKCLASEFVNLRFAKKGIYELQFVDRLGNSYVVKLNISGNCVDKEDVFGTLTYTEFYNSLYNNGKDTREDFVELEELIKEQSIKATNEQSEIEEEVIEVTSSEEQLTNTEDTLVNEKAKEVVNEEKNNHWQWLVLVFVSLIVVVIVFIVYKKLYFEKMCSKAEKAVNEEDESEKVE